MQCQYCSIWWKSPKAFVGKSSFGRVCRETKDMTQDTDEKENCPHFEPCNWVHCDLYGQFSNVFACINKIKNKEPDCRKCRQQRHLKILAVSYLIHKKRKEKKDE